jgi:hypothetical protein
VLLLNDGAGVLSPSAAGLAGGSLGPGSLAASQAPALAGGAVAADWGHSGMLDLLVLGAALPSAGAPPAAAGVSAAHQAFRNGGGGALLPQAQAPSAPATAAGSSRRPFTADFNKVRARAHTHTAHMCVGVLSAGFKC